MTYLPSVIRTAYYNVLLRLHLTMDDEPIESRSFIINISELRSQRMYSILLFRSITFYCLLLFDW